MKLKLLGSSIATLTALWLQAMEMKEIKLVEKFDGESSTLFTKAEIVQDMVSNGLLELTGMGILRGDTTLEFTEGSCRVPEDGYFATSCRLYAFGREKPAGGKIEWEFGKGEGKVQVKLSSSDDAEDIDGHIFNDFTQSHVVFPRSILPVEVTFAANRSGYSVLIIRSLADSSIRRTDANFPLFKTAAEGFDGKFITAGWETVIDEFKVGTAVDDSKLMSAPFVIERAETFNPVQAGWKLVFNDEFEGEKVDWSKWYVPTYYKNTTSEMVSVKDGLLHISCDWMDKEQKLLKTGSLWTREQFGYGYFEARLKFTFNSGWWAAFWLYGSTNADPMEDGFEVDIFEDYYLKRQRPEQPRGNTLDHNLHVYVGKLLKSWNYRSILPGSVDDFYTIGCKWTPFELSYYINGKLIKCEHRVSHSPYDSVTFDAFSHCNGTAALHAIVSGQIWRKNTKWGYPDTTGFTFPEDYIVDYVRVYEYPNAADMNPVVTWKGADGVSTVKVGDSLKVSAEVSSSEKTGEAIKAVYLFDNGYLLDWKSEPPYDFDIPFAAEFFAKTAYMRPGRQGNVPKFDAFPHVIEVFAQDAKGRVGSSGVRYRFPDFGDGAKDYEYNGNAAELTSGEWRDYPVEAPAAGDFEVVVKTKAVWAKGKVAVFVDKEFAGYFGIPSGDSVEPGYSKRNQEWRFKTHLNQGKHTIRLVSWSHMTPVSVELK